MGNFTRAQLTSIECGFDISLAVNMGFLPGYSTIDKFGINPEITTATAPEDVWEFGGIYPFSTTADIVSLTSSDDTDTQDIKIEGLTLDGTKVIQTITLTGHTRAVLTTPLWRVYRMENEADAGNDLAGIVYCFSGTESTIGVPDGASIVKAIIDNGNNQTLMTIYTTPKGKVGFLYRGEFGVKLDAVPAHSQAFMRGIYQSRRFGKVFKIKKSITIMASGSSLYQDPRSFPDIVPALTDIKITIAAISEPAGAWATLDMLLVDEDRFSDEYLTAIGQPGY